MEALVSVEIKAFVPSKDYEHSKQFYEDIGCKMASDNAGIAYFSHNNCSFLLQDFYEQKHAEKFMMHMLVEDIEKWHQHIISSGIVEKYGTEVSDITKQP